MKRLVIPLPPNPDDRIHQSSLAYNRAVYNWELIVKERFELLWSLIASTHPYVISGSTDGTLSTSDVLLDHVAVVSYTLPAALAGSFGGIDASGVTATSDAVFTITKNTTTIGTMTIPASAALGTNSATFSFVNAVAFEPGDHFRLIGPNPADATLSKPFYTFSATR